MRLFTWTLGALIAMPGCETGPAELDAAFAQRETGTADATATDPTGATTTEHPRVLAWEARQNDLGRIDPADLEEGFEPEEGVFAEIVGLEDGGIVTSSGQALVVRLVNTSAEDFALRVATFGDRGSLQEPVRTTPVDAYVAARGVAEVTVAIGSYLRTGPSHSAELVVMVEACPAADPRACEYGASFPVYLHTDAKGQVLVYDQATLCSAFHCGDLTGRALLEPGDVRVMGGGPLRDLRSSEEADEAPEASLTLSATGGAL